MTMALQMKWTGSQKNMFNPFKPLTIQPDPYQTPQISEFTLFAKVPFKGR